MTRNMKLFQSHSNASNTLELHISFDPSTIILDSIGGNFQKLQLLDLSHQKIKFIERTNFAELLNLKEMKLNHNQIEFLPENVFWDLLNLVTLDLNNNMIQALPVKVFSRLANLQLLDVAHNQIKKFSPQLFVDNPKLTEVSAYENPGKVDGIVFRGHSNLTFKNDSRTIEDAGSEYCKDCQVKPEFGDNATCIFSQFGCCSDNETPAHGAKGEG
jgi:Leucine-rich repeat (LRR) protein